MPQRNYGGSKTNVYLVTLLHETSHLKECTINHTIWAGGGESLQHRSHHNVCATWAHVKLAEMERLSLPYRNTQTRNQNIISLPPQVIEA